MLNVKSFTFIELFCVIIIMSILVVISLPNFRNTFHTLQLNSFVRELQNFMNYLSQLSIIEAKPIYLNIDNEKKEYWATIKDNQEKLKRYRIPKEITIDLEKREIFFYPDGSTDKIDIKITSPNNQSVILTTKGIFSGAKIQVQ